MLGWFGAIGYVVLPRRRGRLPDPHLGVRLCRPRRLVRGLPDRPGHRAQARRARAPRGSGRFATWNLGSSRVDPSHTDDHTDHDAADKSGGRVVLWLLLGLGLLIGGAYVGAHYAAADKVARGTTVSGVSIGGHPQAEAAERLQAGLADRVSGPIEATIDGKPVSVDPTAAGIAVDYEASVAEAGGERSWDPVRLWNYFTGGQEFEAEVTVDDAAFATALAGLDEAVRRSAP